MKKRTPRIKIYLKGQVTQVDKYFLDVLALAQFGVKYEEDAVKKEVRKMIRELMVNESVHTQTIHQKILTHFLPDSIKEKLSEKQYGTQE